MAEPLLVLRIIKMIIGVIGLIGNATVATVIFKVKFMHTLTNAFICNQAVVDFLGSLFLILTSNTPAPDPFLDASDNRIACHLWLISLFLWACFTSSTFNLLSVSCERYVAVVYPFKYATLYFKKSVAGIMVVIWLSGFILNGAYEAAESTYRNGRCFYSDGSPEFGIVFIVVQFVIPAIIMLFVYSHMAVELKRSANRIGAIAPTVSASVNSTPAVPGDGAIAAHSENAEQSLLRARRNVFKTLLLVFVTFLVCWTPNQVIFFMFNFGWKLDFTGAIYIISVSLVAINSCANPFIYAFKYRQFRRAFLSLVGRRRSQDKDGTGPLKNQVTTAKD